MKKHYIITILLAMFMSMPMFAYDFEQNGIYYNIEGDHVSVTYSGEGVYQGSVIIPSQVTCNDVTYPVTSIDEYAFEGGEGMTYQRTIYVATAGTLGKYISSDEKYKIEDLTLSGNLNGTDIRLIRDMAGIKCEEIPRRPYVRYNTTNGKLKNLNLLNANIVKGGSGYNAIPEWIGTCTEDCSTLLSTADNSISRYMFHLTKLETIILPKSVKNIGDHAFSGCKDLVSITIPKNITSIASGAFSGCSALASIMVESGHQYYDSRNDCNAIIEKSSNILIAGCKNTIIPNNVTSIGSFAFDGCSSLPSITIPNSVTSIGRYAFSGCSGLTSVTIPNSVTSIDERAFWGCSGLTTIVSEIINPYRIGTNDFYSSDKDIYAAATLLVPKGKKSTYQTTEGWCKFKIIKENINCDVNLDEIFNKNDTKDLVTYIMGGNTGIVNEYKADVNGDQKVNAADVVKLIDILNNGGLGTDSQFDFDNVDGNLVVASLTCTLNNKRDEAIQLTKCELYCKGNLVSYKNYSDCSLAAGGSKDCSFYNLTRHAAGTTDFTVCWHYTVNGESIIYRCPLAD